MNSAKNSFSRFLITASLMLIGSLCTAQDVPSLVLGSEVSGFLSAGDWDYYQITGPFDLSVQYDNGGLYTLASDPHVYVSQDGLPTSPFELPLGSTAITHRIAAQILSLSVFPSGNYFIGFEAGEVAVSYTLTVTPLSVPISTLLAGSSVSETLGQYQAHYYQIVGPIEASLQVLSGQVYLNAIKADGSGLIDECSNANPTHEASCLITSEGAALLRVMTFAEDSSYSLIVGGSGSGGEVSGSRAIFEPATNTLTSICMENTGYPGNGLPHGFSLSSVLQSGGFLTIDDSSIAILETLPGDCEDHASFVFAGDGSIAQIDFHYQNVRIDGAEVIYSLDLVSTSASILNQFPTDVREVRDALPNLSIATGANSVQLSLPDEYMTDGFANGLTVESASGSAVNYTVNGNLLTFLSETPGLQELTLRAVTNTGQTVVERFTLEVAGKESDEDDETIPDTCNVNCPGEDLPNPPPDQELPQPGAGGSTTCFFCSQWWKLEGVNDEYFLFNIDPAKTSDSGIADPYNPGTNFNTFQGTGIRVTDFKGKKGLGFACWEPINWLTVGSVFWYLGPYNDCGSTENLRREVVYSHTIGHRDARSLFISGHLFQLMGADGPPTSPPDGPPGRNTGFSISTPYDWSKPSY